VVEVVANRAAAVGQGTGRVGPHCSAAEGIAAHARIGDALEVGPREFARATGETTRAKISGRTTVERATAVKPTTPVESASAVKVASAVESASAAKVAIATEPAIATEVTGSAEIPAAEVPAAKVAAAAPEVAATAAKVTTTAAKSSAPHRPAATATATKTTTAMAATAAVRPRHRRRRHLARDHSRHDHDSEPTSGLRQPMHRMFSETGCGHKLFINRSSLHSAHLFECQWRGVGHVHAVDPALDHVRRRLPLA
jgi:hypothetical protein